MIGRSAAEWRDFLLAHMPPSEDGLDLREGGLFYRHFEALAIELSRFDALTDQFIVELDPSQTTALLPEWERMLALPRDCATTPGTVAGRRAVIVALLVRAPDLSPAMIIAAAAVIGFTITIKEYFPFTDPADLPTSNAFKYDVIGALDVFRFFRAGESVSGDPLGGGENDELSCLLSEIEPAYAEHTIL